MSLNVTFLTKTNATINTALYTEKVLKFTWGSGWLKDCSQLSYCEVMEEELLAEENL